MLTENIEDLVTKWESPPKFNIEIPPTLPQLPVSIPPTFLPPPTLILPNSPNLPADGKEDVQRSNVIEKGTQSPGTAPQKVECEKSQSTENSISDSKVDDTTQQPKSISET